MRLYERFADKDFHTSVATSFGIDFDAYETIVLPRLRGAGCRNNMVIADARMLTYALAGTSALPRHAGRLYTATGAGATGVFHPKVFLQVGRRRGRVIVSSANLTAPGLAGNLELAGILACDESGSGEQQLIAQAWAYLSRFIGDGRQQGLSNQIEWMLARTPWLGQATAATGPVRLADGTHAALLAAGEKTGIGQRFVELVNEPVSRLIVISPYWDPNLAALSFLANQFAPGELCILLDLRSALFPKRALGRIQNARLYDRGDFAKGRFIHAKGIIAQTVGADHVLLGSANCTTAALGLDAVTGSNEEVSLYRRLPANTVSGALGLTDILIAERLIDPDALPDARSQEELALDELAQQSPGEFECRVDTLIWRPHGVYEPSNCTVVLLDQQGEPIPCRLSPLPAEVDAVRFQIDEAPERPAFACALHQDGRLSAPSIVTLIDRLRAVVRETSSRQADNALRQLDNEPEVSLLLLDVLGVLERIEKADVSSKDPLSIPKVGKNKEEMEREYRKLSYEQFIAGRRPRAGTQTSNSSLAGSDASIVRNFLNRIVGLAVGEEQEVEGEGSVAGDAFNMGDETADAEADLAAGEEFDTPKTYREEEERAKAERRRAATRMATKAEIVAAVTDFHKRIRMRKESGALDNHDIIRLRALLMVICTAAYPGPAENSGGAQSQLRALPSEGDQDSWPLVLGRILFEIFGGNYPAIRSLYLSNEHDQIPDDIVECWATCYWCLQACLTAPLSTREHKRVIRYLRPLAEVAYRLTLPTREELLGDGVTAIMDAMSISYGERLGISPPTISRSHHDLVESLLTAPSHA